MGCNDFEHRLKPRKLSHHRPSENVLIEDFEIEVEYQAETIENMI
jgi:hypothetical protein